MLHLRWTLNGLQPRHFDGPIAERSVDRGEFPLSRVLLGTQQMDETALHRALLDGPGGLVKCGGHA